MKRDGMFCYDSVFVATIIENLRSENEALKAEVDALREELEKERQNNETSNS